MRWILTILIEDSSSDEEGSEAQVDVAREGHSGLDSLQPERAGVAVLPSPGVPEDLGACGALKRRFWVPAGVCVSLDSDVSLVVIL